MNNSVSQWYLSDPDSTINLTTCGPGTYFSGTQSQTELLAAGACPLQCPIGSYAAGIAFRPSKGCNHACNECPVGTYCGETGMGTARACPAGSYSNRTGSPACVECPIRTTS